MKNILLFPQRLVFNSSPEKKTVASSGSENQNEKSNKVLRHETVGTIEKLSSLSRDVETATVKLLTITPSVIQPEKDDNLSNKLGKILQIQGSGGPEVTQGYPKIFENDVAQILARVIKERGSDDIKKRFKSIFKNEPVITVKKIRDDIFNPDNSGIDDTKLSKMFGMYYDGEAWMSTDNWGPDQGLGVVNDDSALDKSANLISRIIYYLGKHNGIITGGFLSNNEAKKLEASIQLDYKNIKSNLYDHDGSITKKFLNDIKTGQSKLENNKFFNPTANEYANSFSQLGLDKIGDVNIWNFSFRYVEDKNKLYAVPKTGGDIYVLGLSDDKKINKKGWTKLTDLTDLTASMGELTPQRNIIRLLNTKPTVAKLNNEKSPYKVSDIVRIIAKDFKLKQHIEFQTNDLESLKKQVEEQVRTYFLEIPDEDLKQSIQALPEETKLALIKAKQDNFIKKELGLPDRLTIINDRIKKTDTLLLAPVAGKYELRRRSSPEDPATVKKRQEISSQKESSYNNKKIEAQHYLKGVVANLEKLPDYVTVADRQEVVDASQALKILVEKTVTADYEEEQPILEKALTNLKTKMEALKTRVTALNEEKKPLDTQGFMKILMGPGNLWPDKIKLLLSKIMGGMGLGSLFGLNKGAETQITALTEAEQSTLIERGSLSDLAENKSLTKVLQLKNSYKMRANQQLFLNIAEGQRLEIKYSTAKGPAKVYLTHKQNKFPPDLATLPSAGITLAEGNTLPVGTYWRKQGGNGLFGSIIGIFSRSK